MEGKTEEQTVAKEKKNKQQDKNRQSINMYIGDNFFIRLHTLFIGCRKLIEDINSHGIVFSEFSPRKHYEKMDFSEETNRIVQTTNAGGSSVISEVLSFEFMGKCFQAHLVKTEMEVEYFPDGGSITDYVCSIFDQKLGVSVTRAVKYKKGIQKEYTEQDAEKLLTKKVKGIVQSTRNSRENWSKQILHIWVPDKETNDIISRVYYKIPPEMKSNTVVMVTNTPASYIYRKNTTVR